MKSFPVPSLGLARVIGFCWDEGAVGRGGLLLACPRLFFNLVNSVFPGVPLPHLITIRSRDCFLPEEPYE